MKLCRADNKKLGRQYETVSFEKRGKNITSQLVWLRGKKRPTDGLNYCNGQLK